jgi:hypothetical protein
VGESLPAAGTRDLWPVADAGDLRPDTGVDDLCSALVAGVTISIAGASLLSPSVIIEPSTLAPRWAGGGLAPVTTSKSSDS